MISDEYDIIRKCFLKYYKENIIVYGTGKLSQNILTALNKYNIVGVLDKNYRSGYFCGYKILSWVDVERYSDGIMVIAASKKNYKEIYNRIKERCIANGFEIVGAWGESLASYPWTDGERLETGRYCKKCKEELKKKIENYDVISFDIFDTLIMRKTLEPTDVFELVEDRIRKKNICIAGFKDIRIAADISCPGGTIYEIYDVFQDVTLISDEEKNIIIEEEIECEKEVLLPRYDMIEILQYALEQKKNVNLISDMYLPNKLMKEILSLFGIEGYTQLYISCEYKTRKTEELFRKYSENNSEKKCLHIGDNYISDIIKPMEYGIDTYEVKSGFSLLKMSNLHGILGYANSINEKTLIGILVSELFNSPFALYDTFGVVTINTWSLFGKIFLGPLVIKYIIEILGYLKIHNDYKGVLFAARDGYIFQKLYEKLRSKKEGTWLPMSHYFLTSRKAALRATMDNENVIEVLKSYSQCSSGEELLTSYMGLTNVSYILPEETINEYLDRNKGQLAAKAELKRRNYERYLKDNQITKEEKYLFCELYSKGTTQYALTYLFDKTLEGFYLMRYGDKQGYPIPITAVYNINEFEKYRNPLKRYEILLEIFLTSPYPSLQEIGELGEPVYEEEKRTKEEIVYMKEVHKGIEEFFDSFMEFYIEEKEIKNKFPESMYMYLDDIIYEGECKNIKQMKMYDNLMHVWRDIY